MLDVPILVGSAVVGLLVGMTGAGGGALMTPMLILLFSVKPSVAISSDLVAAVVMRPFGAAVHFRRGTVNLRLAAWTTAGSVPAAFFGSYLLHLFGDSPGAENAVKIAVGAALLVGAGAMMLRLALSRRQKVATLGAARDVEVRPALALGIGVLGGLVVGITSVGAGSLMIVLFMFAFPALGTQALVGTDLAQAIPLTGAAALGALVFGHVEFSLTASVIVGSVPAVVAGALLSSVAPDRLLRPVITLAILVAGVKDVGASNAVLGWVLLGVIVAGASWQWALSGYPGTGRARRAHAERDPRPGFSAQRARDRRARRERARLLE